ncbi:MAG: hypothetical protein ABSH12_04255 [Endomicrobiales bacterium]|jgi:hypothetical protein
MIRWLQIFSLLVLLSPCITADVSPYDKKQPYVVMLVNNQDSTIPTSRFSGTDTVYACLQLPQKSTGKHLLEGLWYKPDGDIQEHTKVPVDLSPAGAQKVMMWLKFYIKTNITRLIPNEFEGTWKLDVFWDNNKVATSTFTVTCF